MDTIYHVKFNDNVMEITKEDLNPDNSCMKRVRSFSVPHIKSANCNSILN